MEWRVRVSDQDDSCSPTATVAVQNPESDFKNDGDDDNDGDYPCRYTRTLTIAGVTHSALTAFAIATVSVIVAS